MSFAQASELEKYPGNSDKTFPSANDFYQQINRNEYTEYPDSVFKLRRKVLYKEIDDVLVLAPEQFGKASVNGIGYNPARQ
ncbi:hypothetical protein PCCS19_00870 [Paenibacillus sp. CCS19]|nr:hypothetical protein PCCS19_00870 [Paenibacillus cellulosilyticus]